MKYLHKLFAILSIYVLVSPQGLADFILTAGDHSVKANTANQVIPIYATFTSSTSHSIATTGGLQLNVRLGDGMGATGSAPVFQGAQIQDSQLGIGFSSTIWDGGPVDIIGTAPVDVNPGSDGGLADIEAQYGSMGVSFISNSNFRTLSGTPMLVANLFVDTTGVNSGTYAIVLNDDILGQSYFQSSSDVNLIANTFVNNGSLTITAVPEPSSIVMFGGLAGIFAFYKLRRKPSHLVLGSSTN